MAGEPQIAGIVGREAGGNRHEHRVGMIDLHPRDAGAPSTASSGVSTPRARTRSSSARAWKGFAPTVSSRMLISSPWIDRWFRRAHARRALARESGTVLMESVTGMALAAPGRIQYRFISAPRQSGTGPDHGHCYAGQGGARDDPRAETPRSRRAHHRDVRRRSRQRCRLPATGRQARRGAPRQCPSISDGSERSRPPPIVPPRRAPPAGEGVAPRAGSSRSPDVIV